MTQDMSQMRRPLIVQIPGQPDPTSGEYADLHPDDRGEARRRAAREASRAAREASSCQPSYATHGLPDPNVTGPCQLQVSILCEPAAGVQRMDPMDMASTETAFRGYVMCCQPCYEARADEFVRYTHGRD